MNSEENPPTQRVEKEIDPVSIYLREISQHPLLSSEEEQKLASAIEAGIQAGKSLEAFAANEDELGVEELDRKDDLELTVLAGRRAHEKLTNSNLRLVVSVAKNYLGRGLSLLDLIQEGNLGLLHAVDKFDYTLGYRFSTYATWWIRQAISRAIAEKARMIRLPVHVIEHINRQSRAQKELLLELGREPTPAEIAIEMEFLDDEMSQPEEDASECEPEIEQDLERRKNRAAKKVRTLQSLSLDPLSLDSPVASDDHSCLGDFIEDENRTDPAEIAGRHLLARQIQDLLGELNERERSVLILRFGLDDGPERTLEDIGRGLNVTRERVRQIQARAIRKLRHPQHSNKLADYAS